MADGFKIPGFGGRNPDEPPRDFLERFLTDPKSVIWVLLALSIAWGAACFYTVEPGEVAVIRRFGKEVRKAESGLNFLLWPMERKNKVNVKAIRRIEVGFRTRRSSNQRAVSESLMLTGDENIVDAQMIVQYRVQDPSKFLFRLRDPEETLHIAAQVSLRSIVGQTTIDDVLTVGRSRVQNETRLFLQRLMDDYQSGILVTEVKLQVVDPPEQVKDAFHEVVRAREDRERLTNKALGYKEDIIPRARGQAEKKIRDAEGYKEERILQAKGDAARFLALYEEYKKAKAVTRERLYLETIGRILPRAQKLVVDSNVKTTILPFMPVSGSTEFGPKQIETPQTRTLATPKQVAAQPFRRGRV
jgi:modulator of FtsH protease HflK